MSLARCGVLANKDQGAVARVRYLSVYTWFDIVIPAPAPAQHTHTAAHQVGPVVTRGLPSQISGRDVLGWVHPANNDPSKSRHLHLQHSTA